MEIYVNIWNHWSYQYNIIINIKNGSLVESILMILRLFMISFSQLVLVTLLLKSVLQN